MTITQRAVYADPTPTFIYTFPSDFPKPPKLPNFPPKQENQTRTTDHLIKHHPSMGTGISHTRVSNHSSRRPARLRNEAAAAAKMKKTWRRAGEGCNERAGNDVGNFLFPFFLRLFFSFSLSLFAPFDQRKPICKGWSGGRNQTRLFRNQGWKRLAGSTDQTQGLR